MNRSEAQVARLGVAEDKPMEYSAPRPASRWLVIGAGALGIGAIVELIVALVVFA